MKWTWKEQQYKRRRQASKARYIATARVEKCKARHGGCALLHIHVHDNTSTNGEESRYCATAVIRKKIAFDYTSSKSVLNSKCSLESLAYRRQIISLTTFHRYVFHHRDYLADFHFKITNSERRPNKIILPKFKSLSKSLFMFRTAIVVVVVVFILIRKPNGQICPMKRWRMQIESSNK